jgi:predicted transcriptional regulator
MWKLLLLDLAVTVVKKYISSSESKKDDAVLELVKEGTEYLANKTNNTVAKNLSESLNRSTMLKIQKSR